jgi:hypothetical protein
MRNTKYQTPNAKETPNLKPGRVASGLKFGVWCLVFGILPSAFACAACYGKSDSPMAKGMNAGIFSLLGVVVCVLTAIALFFVHVGRRSAAPPPDDSQNSKV